MRRTSKNFGVLNICKVTWRMFFNKLRKDCFKVKRCCFLVRHVRLLDCRST